MRKALEHRETYVKESESVLKSAGKLLLGWLLPGSGHVLNGKTYEGITIFLVIHFMFIYGMFMGSAVFTFHRANPLRSSLEKASQMGVGLVYWIAYYALPKIESWPEGRVKSFARRSDFGRGNTRDVWGEIGYTFTLSAGLLNILMLLRLYHDLQYAFMKTQLDAQKSRRA